MATRRIPKPSPSALQAEQKIAFALLVFLGFGGIVFGFRSFGSHIYRPIQLQFAKYYTGQDVTHSGAQDSEEMEAQKKADTDADSLSDYDELYVYKTSPYLKDSDSDTLEDKAEVFGGTDPNCPAGKDCAGLIAGENTSDASSTTADSFLETAVHNSDSIIQSGKMQFKTKAEAEAFFRAATAAEIRTALIESGADKAAVEKLTDTELQAIYNQAIEKSAAAGSLDNLVTPEASAQAGAGSTQQTP